MSAQHTPGPWGIHADTRKSSKTPLIGPSDNGIPYIVAQVHGGIGHGARDANARLIAAAPELLEALQGLLAACDEGGCFEHVSFDHPHFKPRFDAAHNIVAKVQS